MHRPTQARYARLRYLRQKRSAPGAAWRKYFTYWIVFRISHGAWTGVQRYDETQRACLAIAMVLLLLPFFLKRNYCSTWTERDFSERIVAFTKARVMVAQSSLRWSESALDMIYWAVTKPHAAKGRFCISRGSTDATTNREEIPTETIRTILSTKWKITLWCTSNPTHAYFA